MAFRTITARFPGTCRRCGNSIAAGTRIRFGGRGLTYHLSAECGTQQAEDAPLFQAVGVLDVEGSLLNDDRAMARQGVTVFRNGNLDVVGYRNSRGRCEGAPCCGCCS